MRSTHASSRLGFTLIEILIVLLILGILAALVVPKFASATQESAIESCAVTARNVQTMILHDFAENGQYPATIDEAWFVSNKYPTNPFASGATCTIAVDDSDDATLLHPADKTIQNSGGESEAFWYNPVNGNFRALVAEQATDAQTLELYNSVNKVKLNALGDTD